MTVCETWVANDFLTRHGYEPGPECDHPAEDCPPLRPAVVVRLDRRPVVDVTELGEAA